MGGSVLLRKTRHSELGFRIWGGGSMKAKSSESGIPRRSKVKQSPITNLTTEAGDRTLGMNARICRRDFLNSALLASGSVLLESLSPLQLLAQKPDWGGYTGVGDYAGANGNTEEVM